MIGGGYVGLVSAACFSEFGHEVHVVENNPQRLYALQNGEIPIYEPGLDTLVNTNMRAGRLSFGNNIAAAISDVQAVFIAVGTPPRNGDGHADLQYVYKAADEIAQSLTDYTVIITKSTVPLGTSRKIAERIRQKNPKLDFDIASNPEFLREGNAIGDFMRPDRIIVGTDTAQPERSQNVQAILRTIYRPLSLIEVPILFTNLESAELTKYASNSFLAMKISFINEMADLCDKVGANVHDVARGMGLDKRIGQKFLHPGPGFGGSCFPKDTMALMHIAEEHQAPSRLVEATIKVNETRKTNMASRIIAHCGGSVKNKTLAILGLTFKPETDDMRDAPSLSILQRLDDEGAHIQAFDPVGMETARPLLPHTVRYCSNVTEALTQADAVVILTEWNEFRALPPEFLKTHMRGKIIIDLRNIFDPKTMIEVGLQYYSVGRADLSLAPLP
ncbi:UDP-glucose dehydrogenase family protein [Entomobacter blattae]|nr:UDP-glucose/GDP-mannose dehydrogenase family protein [Entomobacter blattae]